MSGWKVTTNGRGIKSGIKRGTTRGLLLAAEHIGNTSNNQVPIEEHKLEESMDTSVEGMTAVVSYDTEYAVPVHEDMSARHDAGRRAKFLELSFASESKMAAEIIARELRGEL